MIRVLIADDEVLSIRYIKKMIPWEELGYEIVGEAANGKRALELYEKVKPQIILSDIKMPVMDGVELAAEIRKRDTGVNQMAEVFRALSYAARYTVFMEPGKSCSLSGIPVENPDRQLHLHEDLAKLEQYMETGEEEGCRILNGLFEKVMKPVWNLTEFRYLIRNLDTMLLWTAKKQGMKVPALPGTCNTAEEIRDHYRSAFLKVFEMVRQKNTAAYSKAVREVLSYVHEHYGEEITLETAGSLCGLNGVYLGQLFKKEVGVSLTKYLTNYRCEQAKRMLSEGGYTVSQISELVGYQTSQYFSQTFRKVTGMTPQEYKNRGSHA